MCVLCSTQMCVHACASTSRGEGLDMETREPRRSSGIGMAASNKHLSGSGAWRYSTQLTCSRPWGVPSSRLGTRKVARAAKRSVRMCTACMTGW